MKVHTEGRLRTSGILREKASLMGSQDSSQAYFEHAFCQMFHVNFQSE